ncbi:MAG: ATP-binding protein [Phycisphaerae bacterium]|nr:ATP-binding protein [Phycisphaerae bacterium]
MLVEFRVKNFRSFRGEQVLSLVAGSDKSLEENCIDAGKLKLLKTTAIYGPNASGKSNLIKAIDVMRDIVLKSADYKPGEDMPVVPYRLDAESEDMPTEFEVTFIHEKIRYQYGFALTKKRVEEEWLGAFPEGRTIDRVQSWFGRTYDKKTEKEGWEFGSFLKGQKQQLADITKANTLFLSVAAQWNNKQLTTVYEWFQKYLQILPPKDQFAPVTAHAFIDKELKELKVDIVEFVNAFLENADLGIRGVEVSKLKPEELFFPEDMPEEVKADYLRKFKEKPPLEIQCVHHNSDTGEKEFFDLDDESEGTQRLFQLAFPWFQMIALGMTVFADELEASLHPLLTRELIKFVNSAEMNKQGTQLVFATHDTTLLDPELFRRDQIWFTEKDEGGASHLYSLQDYKEQKPRKGAAMQKGYLAGRYGAVPILEAFEIK